MSIAHELSGEIAEAILARREQPGKLEELKAVVLQVHMELQRLTRETRADELERRRIKRNWARTHF